MPLQSSLPEVLSLAEAGAVARYVQDVQNRMLTVVGLLKHRGTAASVRLAETIASDLKLLEKEIPAAKKSFV